ncbi:hypothetical protein HDU93_000026 [Gonapodya sp. JEL0774]|nr:hypothetical protein HDU93_000026 [Gonapodya sp. JEL0774]
MDSKRELRVAFATLSPMYIDLVDDFGGTERFLIDGVGLASDIIARESVSRLILKPDQQKFNKRRDVTKVDFTHGGQLAHFVWCFEKFLNNLTARDCKFQLVWFEDSLQQVQNHPERWSAEGSLFLQVKILKAQFISCSIPLFFMYHIEICKMHLEQNTSIKSHTFRSRYSPEWDTFLISHEPAFVLLSVTAPPPKEGRLFGSTTTGATMEEPFSVDGKLHLVSLLSCNVNVAIFPIEFKGPKVWGFAFYGKPRQVLVQAAQKVDMDFLKETPLRAHDAHVPISQHCSVVSPRLDGTGLSRTDSWFGDIIRKIKPCAHLALAFFLHLAFIKSLPLPQRSFSNAPDLDDDSVAFLIATYKEMSRTITMLSGEPLADLVDGRLFTAMVSEVRRDGGVAAAQCLNESAQDYVVDMMRRVEFGLPSQFLTRIASPEPTSQKGNRDARSEISATKVQGLIPIKHDLVAHITAKFAPLPQIPKSRIPDSVNSIESKSHRHRETHHWHAMRPLKDPLARVPDKRQKPPPRTPIPGKRPLSAARKRALELRWTQQYYTFVRNYAQSLTGSSQLHHHITKSSFGGPQPNAIARKISSKAQAIIDRNMAVSTQKAEKVAREQMDHLFGQVEEIDNPHLVIKFVSSPVFLHAIEQAPASVKVTSQLRRANVLFQVWKAAGKWKAEDNFGAFVASQLFRTAWQMQHVALSSVASSSGTRIDWPNAWAEISDIFRRIGFPEIEESIQRLPGMSTGSSGNGSKSKSSKTPAPWSAVRFQLEQMESVLERDFDQVPDARVKFVPDRWQKDLLDIIDRNESVLVCAPTSSGKTFVAYYSMEKVLRDSPDGVVVYVAPTKALTNQVAAEVYARLVTSEKKSVWGIFTRDGAVWEHCLLLAQCPIIALSATIGNPSKFHQWLANAQKKRGVEMRMIKYDERYSDLVKYVFIAKKWKSEDGLNQANGGEFVRLHPFSEIRVQEILSAGYPADLSLTPFETLKLFDTMWISSNGHALLRPLEPEIFFTTKHRLSKKSVRNWENELKKVFKSWLKQGSQTEGFCRKVVSDLGLQETFKINDEAASDSDTYLETAIDMVNQLKLEDKLPAIAFCFDRNFCNVIAETLNDELEARQERKRAENEVLVRKAEARKDELDRKAKAHRDIKERRAPPKRSQDGTNVEPEGPAKKVVEVLEPALAAWLVDVDPEFSFRGRGHGVDDEEYSEITKAARRVYGNNNPLIVALKRGIGVHHAGCNKSYLQCVEVLFRRRYLSFVIATGTLALGINMPCRSVIFFGDSPYLNALNYRQMSGRAARRGFDDVGHVVFYGIPHPKVRRLMTANLPRLRGHFPLTTTLVLRLMILFNESKDKSTAQKLVTNVLEQPLFTYGVDHQQMSHKFLFTLEYLVTEGLMDDAGQLRGPAGVLAHLHYHEPANFHFVALLSAGVFDAICESFSEDPVYVQYQLLLILSHLFGRRFLPSYITAHFLKERGSHPSKVILEPLPDQAARAIAEHDERALEVFANYGRAFAFSNGSSAPPSLPLSTVPVGASLDSSVRLPNSLISTDCLARSPFSALSGQGDFWDDAEDLTTNAIEGLHLDTSALPIGQKAVTITQRAGSSKPEMKLNRYLLDFMAHGQTKALVSGNLMRAGDVWFALQDFHLALKAICVSLEVMQSGGDEEYALIDSVEDDQGDSTESDTYEEDPRQWDEEEDLSTAAGGSEKSGNQVLSVKPKTLIAFKDLRDEFGAQFLKIWA